MSGGPFSPERICDLRFHRRHDYRPLGIGLIAHIPLVSSIHEIGSNSRGLHSGGVFVLRFRVSSTRASDEVRRAEERRFHFAHQSFHRVADTVASVVNAEAGEELSGGCHRRGLPLLVLLLCVACSSSGDDPGASPQGFSPDGQLATTSDAPATQDSQAEDQLVLDQLTQLGVDTSRPRVIEHFLYFTSERSANEAAVEAVALGCRTNVAPPIPEIPDWGLLCLWDVESVGIESISAHRAALEGIAEVHGGYYDGWGTPVR